MNRVTAINQWLTLAANAGVLLGIVFLIVEIRQNDQMLIEDLKLREASAFRELEAEYINADRMVASDPVLAELIDRANQDSPKFKRFELYMLIDYEGQFARIDHSAFRFWVAGHLSEPAWERVQANVEGRMNSRNLRSRLYMRTIDSMPDDFRERFSVSDYPRELFDVTEFIEP